MKIDLNTHFPHPVLCEGNDDILTGSFDLRIDQAMETTSCEVEIDFALTLTEQHLHDLYHDGDVKAGAFIRCQDTFYSELRTADGMKGTWKFRKSALYGRVEVKPLLWLVVPLENWSSPNVNTEFGGAISLGRSEVIGLGADTVFVIGQDKLKKFESIFELVPSDDIPKGRMKVDLLSDAIRILVAPEFFRSIELMRGNRGGKSLLLSAVYMPVVMEVLENLRGKSGLEDKPWYRVFSAKCETMGIDMNDAPLLESAQRLLASPVEKLEKSYLELTDND